MHSRRDVRTNDESVFSVDFEVGKDGIPVVASLDATSSRHSWRRSCAAKRSIERLREEQLLKAQVEDAFDDDCALNDADLDAD